MSHVLSSGPGMPIYLLLRVSETDDGTKVPVHWKGLSYGEDTLDLIQNVSEHVHKIFIKLLHRRSTSYEIYKSGRDSLSFR